MGHIVPGVYQHYKGKRYRVLCVADNSETREKVVVYEALYDTMDTKYWVRPFSLFASSVELENGSVVPRFQLLEAAAS